MILHELNTLILACKTPTAQYTVNKINANN